MDHELLHHWFIAGRSPGAPQSVSGWAADTAFIGEPTSLEAMMEYLHIKERNNAATTDIAEKGKLY